jgi:uncharacterized membrane protein
LAVRFAAVVLAAVLLGVLVLVVLVLVVLVVLVVFLVVPVVRRRRPGMVLPLVPRHGKRRYRRNV